LACLTTTLNRKIVTDLPVPHRSPRGIALASTWIVLSVFPVSYAIAESAVPLSKAIEHAKVATVGILHDAVEAPLSPRQAQISVLGTGVHLGEGYIVTARHVVERQVRGSAEPSLPEEIHVLTNALDEVSARLSSGSAFLDLVVYQVTQEARPSLPGFALFTEKEAEPGQEVFTVGYPLGWGPAVAFGRVGNPSVFLPTVDTRLVQADVSVCSGNSGGGLFNVSGELIGIMHAIIQTERGKEALGNERCSRFAFAVPTLLAKRIVQAIQRGQQPAFSRLGIRMNTIKQSDHWLITAAEVSGPALAGGVKKGDILLAIDGTEIKDPAHLKTYLMERTLPGQKVRLRLRRADKELELAIVLGGA
jgi:serine protease Do